MRVEDFLTKCGYKLQVVNVDGEERSIIVLDEAIVDPELKPVAIGGKLVVEE